MNPMNPMIPGQKLPKPAQKNLDMNKNFQIPEKMKEKDKIIKKEGDENKVLNLVQNNILTDIFKSLQISLKNGNELIFLSSCKKIFIDLEIKAKEKKLKGLSKEIPELLANFNDRIKAEILDKKDKKKSVNTELKINENELIKFFHEVYNLSIS